MMRSIEVGSLAVALLLACGARAADYRNGLSDADRKVFYHLAEGSEVYPLDWLRVLESKQTGKSFLDNMERFGFLPDPGNADGLPVGPAAAKARGLTLSAALCAGAIEGRADTAAVPLALARATVRASALVPA